MVPAMAAMRGVQPVLVAAVGDEGGDGLNGLCGRFWDACCCACCCCLPAWDPGKGKRYN